MRIWQISLVPIPGRKLLLGMVAIIVVAIIPIAVVALCVRMTSAGPALYWSNRVGRRNEIFRMPKFIS